MPLSQIDPISGLAVAPGLGLPATKKLPPSVAEWATDQAEVAAFCDRHDVFDEAELAVALARKHYGNGRMRIRAEYDPGYPDDEWLAIEVKVEASVERVIAMCDHYTREWISGVAVDKIVLVRVVYSFR